MKTISVAVLESDYEAFRQAAEAQGRPIAQLIREAMGVYKVERLKPKTRLTELQVFTGHRFNGHLPTSEEIMDEISDWHWQQILGQPDDNPEPESPA